MLLNFDTPGPRRISDSFPGGVHTNDPETSFLAANDPGSRRARVGQRERLLKAFEGGRELTDEEAGTQSGVGGYNERRRCTELRQLGLIAPTGSTKIGSAGKEMMVCRITSEGVETARG